MLTPEQINAISVKLNDEIDVPFVPEMMEGALFEIAITAVSNKLGEVIPPHWIPYLNDSLLGLTGTDEQVEALVNDYASRINEKVDIPLVTEDREQELIEAILGTIFEALREGGSLLLD